MNILLATLGDPIWQILTFIIVLALPLLIVAVRTHDVHAPADKRHQETRRVLLAGLIVFILVSSVEALLQVPRASSSQASSLTPTSIATSLPTAVPTLSSVPSPSPSPTATPQLARSITAVLVTFCNALSRNDDQTAWQQYATSLQHRHPEAKVIVAWQRFTRCTVPEQSGDPAAWTVLTLSLAPGFTDQFGRSGDIDYRFTLSVEDAIWKIVGVCDIMAEGCFPVSWG